MFTRYMIVSFRELLGPNKPAAFLWDCFARFYKTHDIHEDLVLLSKTDFYLLLGKANVQIG